MSDKLSTPTRNWPPTKNLSSEPRPTIGGSRPSIIPASEPRPATRPSPLRNSISASASSEPRPAVGGRPSILSQSRRSLSSSNSIFGSARTVSFAENPVTMSQSPPQLSPASTDSESTPLRGRRESRSSSLPPTIRSTNSSDENLRSRSVKHLTCFWWKEKGTCKYSEEECLYAHYDTGRYTDAPRQLNPDEPAKAGRNLARALGDLTLQRGHRSTSSLLSSPAGSRPSTPISSVGSRTNIPLLLGRTQSPVGSDNGLDAKDLAAQVDLYRKIIDIGTQEKTMMLDLINELKNKVIDREATIVRVESDKDFLARENHALKAAFQQSVGNNYGAVGSVGPPGLGNGLSNTFAGVNVANIPAWAPAGGLVDGRPGSPGTNPSEDGDYLDMRVARDYGSGQ